MEEKYFVNTIDPPQENPVRWWTKRPKDLKLKDGCTWKELLNWCHRSLWTIEEYGRWRNETKYRNPSYQEIDAWFSNFRNNPNDGIYTCGRWKQNSHCEYIQQKDDNGRLTSEWRKTFFFDDWVWIPPTFTPKRFQVTDSYGRIIPSGYLRQEYMEYVYDATDDTSATRHIYGYNRYRWRMVNHYWEFRKDPIPGINSMRQKGRYWHKYRGKHGHTIQELKQYHRDIIEQKEVQKEYGITFKIHRTWMDLDPWNHGHHRGTKGRTWKRTRGIRKQYERKLVNTKKARNRRIK